VKKEEKERENVVLLKIDYIQTQRCAELPKVETEKFKIHCPTEKQKKDSRQCGVSA